MCAYFVDVSALEDMISERVKVTSAWTEGFVSWFEEWESNLRLHAGINIQGGSRCDGWLRHREMRGYDVCGDSRLGSKCRCSGAVLYISWWSSVQR